MAKKLPLVEWPDGSYTWESPPLTWRERLNLLAGFLLLLAFTVLIVFAASLGAPA